jgi:hypothetical protein
MCGLLEVVTPNGQSTLLYSTDLGEGRIAWAMSLSAKEKEAARREAVRRGISLAELTACARESAPAGSLRCFGRYDVAIDSMHKVSIIR